MRRQIEIFIIVVLLIFLFLLSNILIDRRNLFLKVVFLDVGQGDAIFIETPNGQRVLIDSGANGSVVRQLSRFIPFYSREINLLIATHSDSDHVGGVPEIIKRFNINWFGKNSIVDSDSLNTEIQKTLDNKKVNQIILNTGDKIIIDKENNIYLEVLWPTSDIKTDDNNDNSIIVRLVYNQIAIMLTGDASIEVEKVLIKSLGDNLISNILKAGHHGSKTSTSNEFLHATNPDFVIISADKESRFGHPHQEVIDRIVEFSNSRTKDNNKPSEILSTAEIGSIYFQSDGKNIWLK
jgi:competence protein ComEC